MHFCSRRVKNVRLGEVSVAEIAQHQGVDEAEQTPAQGGLWTWPRGRGVPCRGLKEHFQILVIVTLIFLCLSARLDGRSQCSPRA